MNSILEFYRANRDWISFIKDAVFLFGAYKLIRYLGNLSFIAKTKVIDQDLKTRETIDEKLKDYILEKHRNGIKDIAVRFVWWKNYPWKLNDDGYKHFLAIDDNGGQTLPYGWIDKTGVNFQEHIWFFGQSIYVDKNGIFFFAPKEHAYKGFQELRDKRLLLHLPFSNIVNFDFKEFIEYEPVFYVRHAYCDHRKLYDRIYICREKSGDAYFRLELDRRYHIRRYCFLRYILARSGMAVDAAVLIMLKRQRSYK